MITAGELFDLSHSLAGPFLQEHVYPWRALDGIGEEILRVGRMLSAEEYDMPFPDVWISKSACVHPLATVMGPAIIGAGTQVRAGALLRGCVLVGEKAVVGNATELKNTILFDRVQVPHYNYVGDSILGFAAHFGAGAIASNVRLDKAPVVLHYLGKSAETGRKKVGAMVGDGAEVGCHAVLNPGCILGRRSRVYPLSCVCGGVAEDGTWCRGGAHG